MPFSKTVLKTYFRSFLRLNWMYPSDMTKTKRTESKQITNGMAIQTIGTYLSVCIYGCDPLQNQGRWTNPKSLSLCSSWCYTGRKERYLYAISNWETNWDVISLFFQFSEDIRRIMYTTNIIEGVNRQFRKVTKTKSVFPNDTSLEKML